MAVNASAARQTGASVDVIERHDFGVDHGNDQITRTMVQPDRNIDAIMKLEHEARHKRPPGALVADWVIRGAGTIAFIILHIGFFTMWICVNVIDSAPFTIVSPDTNAQLVGSQTFTLSAAANENAPAVGRGIENRGGPPSLDSSLQSSCQDQGHR